MESILLGSLLRLFPLSIVLMLGDRNLALLVEERSSRCCYIYLHKGDMASNHQTKRQHLAIALIVLVFRKGFC